jgi:hypothetical protein
MSNKYHLHVTGKDSLGLNFIENLIEMANLGATLKEGTIPNMRFPHSVSLVLEAEQPPVPNACIRVFEYDSCKEVFAAFVEPVASGFSLDTDTPVVDTSTNAGVPWTKDQLEAMEWETEFKKVMTDAGIGGRKRDTMTNAYLAKFKQVE